MCARSCVQPGKISVSLTVMHELLFTVQTAVRRGDQEKDAGFLTST